MNAEIICHMDDVARELTVAANKVHVDAMQDGNQFAVNTALEIIDDVAKLKAKIQQYCVAASVTDERGLTCGE